MKDWVSSNKGSLGADASFESLTVTGKKVYPYVFDPDFHPGFKNDSQFSSWLDCSVFDDDLVFPDTATCTSNDWDHWCSENASSWRKCENIDGTCWRAEEICGLSCTDSSASFADVCLNQAIAHLPEVCDNTFVPFIPTGKNHEPSLLDAWEYWGPSEANDTVKYHLEYGMLSAKGDDEVSGVAGDDGNPADPCSVHSFCSTCVKGKNGMVNVACKQATLIETKNAQFNMLEKLDFYCQKNNLDLLMADKLHDALASDEELKGQYKLAKSQAYVFPAPSAETVSARKKRRLEFLAMAD